jgi:hypothetical protein
MSTLTLHAEELRVESFVVGETTRQPADAVAGAEPNTWPDCPTATGCTCVATCFGGVCHTAAAAA